MVIDGTSRVDVTYDAMNDYDETPNELLRDADEPLWKRCKAHTKLLTVT